MDPVTKDIKGFMKISQRVKVETVDGDQEGESRWRLVSNATYLGLLSIILEIDNLLVTDSHRLLCRYLLPTSVDSVL